MSNSPLRPEPPAHPALGAVWAVAVLALLGSVGAIVVMLTSSYVSRPAVQTILTIWISVPYILSGLVAWWRRPANRMGLLMIAAGFVSLTSSLQWSSNPLLYTIGQMLDLPLGALYLHVILAYPHGRLPAGHRPLVIAAYIASIGLSAVALVLGGFDATRSLIAFAVDPAAALVVENVQLYLLSAIMLTGFAVVLNWRLRAGRMRRQALSLIVDAFALILLMISILLLAGAMQWSGFQPLQWATLTAIGIAPVVFLFGVLDARLARGGVTDLLVQLRSGAIEDLRGPLSRALRDPSLQVAYWLPEFRIWADQTGQPVELPEPGQRRAATVIDRDGAPVAALIHDITLADEPELLEAVGAAAAIALEHGRMRSQLLAQVQEVNDSRARVLEAGRRERQRLERDLHDGAQQRLVALSLELGLLEPRVAEDPQARAGVQRARQEITRSLQELRDIARGLYPAVLEAHGLPVALETLSANSAVPARLEIDLPDRLPAAVEVAAYYVVSECLTNVAKHAKANEVVVSAMVRDSLLVVEVADDGVGGADDDAGSGLRGLSDRVQAVAGTLRVRAGSPSGTVIRAEIPCG